MTNQPRAWQLEHCEMCEVTAINHNSGLLGFGRQLDQEHFNEPDYWLSMNECVIMFPSNSKDVNGDVIFDGDLIQHPDFGIGTVNVEFDVATVAFNFSLQNLAYLAPMSKIVGNIYEEGSGE